jgi:hypothetical protein
MLTCGRAAYLDADLPLVKKHAAARARLGSAPMIRAVLEHQPSDQHIPGAHLQEVQ